MDNFSTGWAAPGTIVLGKSPLGKSPIVIAAIIRYDAFAGWSSLVARWAHNPKVAGSNPAPATKWEQRPKAASSLFYCGYELSLHSYLSDLVAASLFLFSELRTFENKSP